MTQTNDFTAQLSSAQDKAQQAFSAFLDAGQKATERTVELAQRQLADGFDLARSALSVRDFEGARGFFFDSARVARESFERAAQAGQEVFVEQAKVAQGVAAQVRDEVKATGKRR